MTRLVLVSDTHGRHEQVDIPDGDVLIHAGDFCRGRSITVVHEFNSWLSGLPHEEKLVVAGNCDHIFEHRREEAEAALDAARYLQDDTVEIDGLTFWGSPWQPVFLDMAFNVPRGRELAEKWAEMPDELDVLITHAPPRDILDETSRGEVVGDRALRERVEEVRPTLHVFGHIHESYGERTLGATHFVNAACNDPSRSPIIFEI